MRRLGVIALFALLCFTVPVQALDPLVGQWKQINDPIGVTPAGEVVVENADDGDTGILYEDGSGWSFSRSADGVDSFGSPVVIATGTPAGTPGFFVDGDNWTAVVGDGTTWYVYQSNDDGATWDELVNETYTHTDLEVAKVGSNYVVGAASVASGASYWRTGDNFATWNRNAVAVCGGANAYDVEFLVWSATNIDLWCFEQNGGAGSNDALVMSYSDDAAGFFSNRVVGTEAGFIPSGGDMASDFNGQVGIIAYGYDTAGAGVIRALIVTSSGDTGTFASLSGTTVCGVSEICASGDYVAAVGNTAYVYANAGQATTDWSLQAFTVGDSMFSEVAGTSLMDDSIEQRYGVDGGHSLVIAAPDDDFSDRFEVHYTAAPPTGIAASATLVLDNIIGLDVDVTGIVGIARYEGGDKVNTFGASTMQPSSNEQSTNCNQFGGVAALPTHVSFFHCDSGTGDPDQLRIRSPNMGSPDISGCGSASFCEGEINDEDLAANQDEQIELQTVLAVPFDYSEFENPAFDTASVDAAWAYTDNDGVVGVMTYTWINNAPDFTYADEAVVDPSGGTVDQMCITLDSNGQTFLYGASQNSNVLGFRVDFTEEEDFLSFDEGLSVDLVQVFSGTTSTSGAKAVSCGEGRFVTANADRLTFWARGANTPYVTVEGAEVHRNGLAMSDDGLFVAYVDESSMIHILNATSGEETREPFDMPDGIFRFIRINGRGTNIWVATNSTIGLYDIHAFTTIDDVASTLEDAISTTPSTGGEDLDPTVPGVNVGQVANGLFGGSVAKAGWFIFLLLAVALTFGMASIHPMLAFGGFAISAGVGWSWELVPDWFIFVLFVVALLVAGLTWGLRR